MATSQTQDRSDAGCTFGAVGDIALAGPTAAAMSVHGPEWLLERVGPALAQADVLFGNLECVVVPESFPQAQIDPRGLVGRFDGTAALRAAGFDILSLANNHILDGGTLGLAHTRDLVASRGMVAAGVGPTQEQARELQVLDHGGLRFGVLAYAEDSNYSLSTTGPGYAYYEPDTVLADIAAARPEVDVLVVSVHADLEFMETPAPPRRDAFRAFAAAGATLVLGHHPHVPQGLERVGDSLIAYSLGNFVFHAHTSSYLSPHLPHTAQTFLLLAEVSRNGVESFTRVPLQIGRPPDERPLPLGGDELAAADAYLKRLDDLVTDDRVVAENWRKAAIDQLRARLRLTAQLTDPDDVLQTLASLLHVAENRAWVDEIGIALAERWDEQRERRDLYHRPAFGSAALAAAQTRSLRQRLAGRIRTLGGRR